MPGREMLHCPALSWPSRIPSINIQTAAAVARNFVFLNRAVQKRGCCAESVSPKQASQPQVCATGVDSETSISDRPRVPSPEDDEASFWVEESRTDRGSKGVLKSGLYLVATPIGNLEDITLRALRVLRSADVILSEDTRHSGKLLQHYSIRTPLLSYHKFNENQRESAILKRLKQGEIVALISDAGTPGISDPGMVLAKICTKENIPVVPIPGPCAFVAALSASGLSTDEFTFVGFLPKHAGSRRKRLQTSAMETATQIFYVPPHKIHQFLEEVSCIFTNSRQCVIAREITKLHEEFWHGTLASAKEAFSSHQPKGEITFLIEGNKNIDTNLPSEAQLEHELRELISKGHSISMAVKLVAEGTSMKRKTIYSLALKIFEKQDAGE